MLPIRNQADVDAAVLELVAIDPVLAPIAARIDTVPLRLRDAGFEGLARIVVSQQVSVASANAIWERLVGRLLPLSTDTVNACNDAQLQEIGLSRPKIKTFRAIVAACHDGLNIEDLAMLPEADARKSLTAIHGIGPWSADVFLMFCAGHRDIFPVGDVALQIIAQHVLDLPQRPSEKLLAKLAQRWQPHRSVAARILWAYYGLQKAAKNTGTQNLDAANSKLPI